MSPLARDQPAGLAELRPSPARPIASRSRADHRADHWADHGRIKGRSRADHGVDPEADQGPSAVTSGR